MEETINTRVIKRIGCLVLTVVMLIMISESFNSYAQAEEITPTVTLITNQDQTVAFIQSLTLTDITEYFNFIENDGYSINELTERGELWLERNIIGMPDGSHCIVGTYHHNDESGIVDYYKNDNFAIAQFIPTNYFNVYFDYQDTSYYYLSSTPSTDFIVTYSGTLDNNLTWTLTNSTLTISGNGAMKDFFNESKPWNEYAQKIKHINIEDGVTKIGDTAFTSLPYLENVVVGKDVSSIGYYAFYASDSLRNIDFKRATPPAIYDGALGDTLNTNLKITVPFSSVNDYITKLVNVGYSEESVNNVVTKSDTVNAAISPMVQYKKDAENSYTLRVVYEICRYTVENKVGEVGVIVKDGDQEVETVTGHNVFSSIIANGATVSPINSRDNCFVVVEIYDVPEDANFQLVPYASVDGTSIISDATAVNLNMQSILNN